MTQPHWKKRIEDANKDPKLKAILNLLEPVYGEGELERIDLAEDIIMALNHIYIGETEAQRIRADKAEQEYMIQFEKYSNDLRKAAESLGKATTANMSLFESAEVVMQERDKLINLLEKIETALEYHEWTDYMQYVSDEITAYREGSNTDAK